MILTGHALLRYLERIEGMSFEAEKAVCAAELGLTSSNALDCARFLGWMRKMGMLDTAHWSARCVEAIKAGEIDYVDDDHGTIITVLPPHRHPYIPTRQVDPWRDPVSRQARRRILREKTFADESYRDISPRRRRF